MTRTFYGIPLHEDIDTVYISVNVYLDEDDWVTSQEIFSIEVLPTTTRSSSSLQAVDGFSIANIEAFRNEVPWTSFCSEGFSLYPLQCPSGSSTVQANVHINCDIISMSPTERISIILSVSQLLAVCPLQLTLYAENDNVMAFIIAEDRVGNPMANMITVSLLIHCDGSNLYPIIIQDAVQLLEGILNTTVLNNTLTLQAWSITSSNANSHEIVSPRRVRRQLLPPDDPTTSSDEFMTESIPFLTSSIVPFPSRVTSLPILIVTSEIATSDDFPSLSIIESSSPDLFISPTTTVLHSSSSLTSNNEFSSLMISRDMSSHSDLISDLGPIMTASSDFLFPSSPSSREISMTDLLPSSAESIPSIPTDILSSSSDFIMSSFMESTASTFIFDSPTSSLLEPTSVVSSSIITSSSDFHLSSSQLLSSSKDPFSTISIFESPTSSILLPETTSSMLFESPTPSILLPETSSSMLFKSPTPSILLPETTSSMLFESPTPSILLPETSSSMLFESPTPSILLPETSSSMLFESPTLSSLLFETSSMSFILESSSELFESPTPTLFPDTSSSEIILKTTLTPISSGSDIFEPPPPSFIQPPISNEYNFEEPTSSSISIPIETSSFISPIPPSPSEDLTPIPSPTDKFSSSPSFSLSSSDEISSSSKFESSLILLFSSSSEIISELLPTSSIEESVIAVPSIEESLTAVTSIAESSTAIPSIDETFTAVTSIEESSTALPSIEEPFTSVTSIFISSTSTTNEFPSSSFTDLSSSVFTESFSMDISSIVPSPPSTQTPTPSSTHVSPFASITSELFSTSSEIPFESSSEFITESFSTPFVSESTSSRPLQSSSIDMTRSLPPSESTTTIVSSPVTSSEITSGSEFSTFLPTSTQESMSLSVSISPSSILPSVITSSFIEESSTSIILDVTSTITEPSFGFTFEFSTSPTEVTSLIEISSTEILSSTITSSIDISPSSTEILSSTITSSSEAPSPSPTNNVPLLLNPIGALLVQEGVIFSHSIPDDMFYDIEDGYNLTLRLQSEANWIGIMNQNVIVGLPLSTEIIGRYITRYEIEIRAYDHNGEFASEIITVSVNPRHSLLHDNYIQVTIDENFTIFNENVTAKVDLITKLGKSDPNDVYVYSLTSGSVVISYTNISIRRDDCTEFNNFVNAIYHSRNYTDVFKAQINPYIPMGPLKVFGMCNRSVGTYETIQPTIEMINDPISEQLIFLAVVLPLVALACILLILCLAVFLTYRWRRMERNYILHDEQKILLNRKPIVFLDESESLSRSRRPTILTGRSRGSGYHSLVNTESEGLDDTFTTIPEQDTVSVTNEALEFPFVEILEPSRPNAPPPYRLPPQLH